MKGNFLQRVLLFPFAVRQRRLARERPALSKEQFITSIAVNGGDTETATWLYDKLQKWIIVDKFTVYPSDDFQKVFGIAEEELDEDILLEMIDTFSSSLPDEAFMQEFGAVSSPLKASQLISRLGAL